MLPLIIVIVTSDLFQKYRNIPHTLGKGFTTIINIITLCFTIMAEGLAENIQIIL